MSEPLRVERHEDMSRLGRLAITIQVDGDIIVSVIPDPDEADDGLVHSAEFCTIGAGGGRSPHTREALRQLFKAMQLDNEERPLCPYCKEGIH